MLQLVVDNGIVLASVGQSRCQIVDGRPHHLRLLADGLRAGDREEIAAQRMGPYRVLRRTFRDSLWSRTAFVDGEIAAMFGLGGLVLSDLGLPWLLTTPAVERIPVTFVKRARDAVQDMLNMKPRLENHVLASYTGACRLLEVLGFLLDEPHPYGPDGVMFRRFHLER